MHVNVIDLIASHIIVVITRIKIFFDTIFGPLGLNQHSNSVPVSALLDLLFTNINSLCVSV
jgi:hypothetical protein